MFSTSSYLPLQPTQVEVTISSQGRQGPLSIDMKSTDFHISKQEAYHYICTQVCGTRARAAACTP